MLTGWAQSFEVLFVDDQLPFLDGLGMFRDEDVSTVNPDVSVLVVLDMHDLPHKTEGNGVTVSLKRYQAVG